MGVLFAGDSGRGPTGVSHTHVDVQGLAHVEPWRLWKWKLTTMLIESRSKKIRTDICWRHRRATNRNKANLFWIIKNFFILLMGSYVTPSLRLELPTSENIPIPYGSWNIKKLNKRSLKCKVAQDASYFRRSPLPRRPPSPASWGWWCHCFRVHPNRHLDRKMEMEL